MTTAATSLPEPTRHALDVLKTRRSIYALNKEMPITEAEAVELIKASVRAAPSPLDFQTTRVCVLTGQHHDALWNTIKDALRMVTDPEKAAAGAKRIDTCFRSGYGTVLFFEDERAVQEMRQFNEVTAKGQARDNHYYRILCECSDAAAQLAVWSVLAKAGVGASVQHYQTIAAERVRKMFRVPHWWTLNSMMPFGGVGAPAGTKSYLSIESRFLVKDEDGLSSHGQSNSVLGSVNSSGRSDKL